MYKPSKPGVERFSCDSCRKAKSKCRPVYIEDTLELNEEVDACTRCHRLGILCTVDGQSFLQYQLRLTRRPDVEAPATKRLRKEHERLMSPFDQYTPDMVQGQSMHSVASHVSPNHISPNHISPNHTSPVNHVTPPSYPTTMPDGLIPFYPTAYSPNYNYGFAVYNPYQYPQAPSPGYPSYSYYNPMGGYPTMTSPSNPSYQTYAAAHTPQPPPQLSERSYLSWFAVHLKNLQELNVAIEQLGLDDVTLEWLVSDYFLQSMFYMQAILFPPFLVNHGWRAYPMSLACIILACFTPKHGTLADTEAKGPGGKSPTVDKVLLRKLLDVATKCWFSVIDETFSQSPDIEPHVPLGTFLEACSAIEVIHNIYSFVITERLFRSYQLGIGILAKFQLHRFDLWNPKRSKETPPNHYIQQLWEDSTTSLLPGEPAVWREMTRKLVWQLAMTDLIYAGIFDERPRTTPKDLGFAACPVPDDVFKTGQDMDQWDTYNQFRPGHPMYNLSWMLLPKGHVGREAGFALTVGDIREKNVGMLNCMTSIIGSAVMNTTFEGSADGKGVFKPFEMAPNMDLEVCVQAKEDPLGFWLEFIDDMLLHLQPPLKDLLTEGKTPELWLQCEEWIGHDMATRFFVYLIRLFDCRLRLSAWTPQMSLTPFGRALALQVRGNILKAMGDENPPVCLHGPSPWLPLGQSTGWFRIFSHASLEGVLEDCICISELMRTLIQSQRPSDKVRFGHSVLSVATRVSLIYGSLVAWLKRSEGGKLLESAMKDGQVHIRFLQEANRMSMTDQAQNFWIAQLDNMLSNYEEPTPESATTFFMSFMEGAAKA